MCGALVVRLDAEDTREEADTMLSITARVPPIVFGFWLVQRCPNGGRPRRIVSSVRTCFKDTTTVPPRFSQTSSLARRVFHIEFCCSMHLVV